MSPQAPKPQAPKHVISLDVKTFVALVTVLLGAGVGGTSLASRESKADPAVCSSFEASAERLTAAVSQLNIQVAVFAERQEAMGKRLDALEARRGE